MKFWLLVLLGAPTAAILARCVWVVVIEPARERQRSRKVTRRRLRDLIREDQDRFARAQRDRVVKP